MMIDDNSPNNIKNFYYYNSINDKKLEKKVMGTTQTDDSKKYDENALIKKNTLKSMIERVRMMNGDSYTADSWQHLLKILPKALSVYHKDNPTQSDVNNAITSILAAMNGLRDKQLEGKKGNNFEKDNIFLNSDLTSVAQKQMQSEASVDTISHSVSSVSDHTGT